MADEKPILGSKEIIIGIITIGLGEIEKAYGVGGVSPESIYAVGVFLMMLARIFWTKTGIDKGKLF